MFGFSDPKSYGARKYVDLIRKASSNWANWDPSRKLEPGDFGELNRNTGLFEKHGSIYALNDTLAVAESHRPTVGKTKNYKQVVSEHVKVFNMDVGPHADFAGLAEASINLRLEFGSNRGAFLIMHEPRTSYIPGELVDELSRNPIKCLKGKMLITDVLSCSSYAMYLSGTRMESVNIALISSAPLPVTPGVSIGGGVSAGWKCSGYSGVFEHGHTTSHSFFPLYVVKEMKVNTRRGSPDPNSPEVEYTFKDAETPWNLLDDEGNEVMFEDSSEEED